MTLATWMYSGEDADSIAAEEKWVEVDGRRIRYLKAGSGPDLVLLHGLLGSADCWERVFPHLAKDSTVYAIDALGCGKSDRVSNLDAGLGAAAERLLAFLNAVGLERVDLLGTSHGGSVAMTLAARYPRRIRNLILHAPANPYSKAADPLIFFYQTMLGRWFAHRMLTMPRRLQRLALARMYGTVKDIREGLIERHLGCLLQKGTIEHQLEIVRNFSRDMKLLTSEIPLLASHPVLILWGTHDRVVSLQSGMELRKLLPNVTVTLLPGAGHLPYEESPEEFAQAVNLFLRKQNREVNLKPVLVEREPRQISSAA